jgi:hypothetical protein
MNRIKMELKRRVTFEVQDHPPTAIHALVHSIRYDICDNNILFRPEILAYLHTVAFLIRVPVIDGGN